MRFRSAAPDGVRTMTTGNKRAMSGQEHGGSGRAERRVTIYTAPACHWCRVAKRYLDQHAIAYHEVDIAADRRGRREMVMMTGQHGVPVLRVGERAMIGWDAREFELLRDGPKRRR
jgi:glutaredoxin